MKYSEGLINMEEDMHHMYIVWHSKILKWLGGDRKFRPFTLHTQKNKSEALYYGVCAGASS